MPPFGSRLPWAGLCPAGRPLALRLPGFPGVAFLVGNSWYMSTEPAWSLRDRAGGSAEKYSVETDTCAREAPR